MIALARSSCIAAFALTLPSSFDACGAEAPTRQLIDPPHVGAGTSVPSPASRERVGEFIGHLNTVTKELTLEPVADASAVGAVHTEGFTKLAGTGPGYGVAAATTNATIGPNSAFPTCLPTQMCANVTLRNASSPFHVLTNVWAQLSLISGTATVNNSTPLPAAGDYALAYGPTWGRFQYGDLTTASASQVTPWIFDLGAAPAPAFNFHVTVYATLLRTNYTASVVNGTNGDGLPFIDACSLTGASTLYNAALPSPAVQPVLQNTFISLPFPFVFLDTVFDTSTANGMNIASNGAIGLSDVTAIPAHRTIPDATGFTDYTLFPFWNENLQPGASGVCYASTSAAAPNRQFVVTWKDAALYDGTSTYKDTMTFSVLLTETTDTIAFMYRKWDTTSCGTHDSTTQGGGATIGIQGVGALGTAASSGTVLSGFNSGTVLSAPSRCDATTTITYSGALL
jgi:hypothetical protein